MKKITFIMLLLSTSISLVFGDTLKSMSKKQIEHDLINKTFVSIPTDNLNGRTIANTFSMFMDNKGNVWGRMSNKPTNEPQSDHGVYSIAKDGTVYFTWQHWDSAKKLSFHVFETNNAYLSISCDHIFHTAFMKEDIKTGNQLNPATEVAK